MENISLDVDKVVKKGKKFFDQKKYLSAMEQFEIARVFFKDQNDDLMQAEMDNNLSVCHLMAGDAPKALKAAKGTERIFAKHKDSRRQGMALGNQAAAQEALKQFAEALELYRRSENLLKQAGDRESRSIVLKHISALQVRTGEKYQALASMDAALNEEPRPSTKEKVLKKMLGRIFRSGGKS